MSVPAGLVRCTSRSLTYVWVPASLTTCTLVTPPVPANVKLELALATSGIGRGTSVAINVEQPGLSVQSLSQPSPGYGLASSHCSVPDTMPFPQAVSVQLASQP